MASDFFSTPGRTTSDRTPVRKNPLVGGNQDINMGNNDLTDQYQATAAAGDRQGHRVAGTDPLGSTGRVGNRVDTGNREYTGGTAVRRQGANTGVARTGDQYRTDNPGEPTGYGDLMRRLHGETADGLINFEGVKGRGYTLNEDGTIRRAVKRQDPTREGRDPIDPNVGYTSPDGYPPGEYPAVSRSGGASDDAMLRHVMDMLLNNRRIDNLLDTSALHYSRAYDSGRAERGLLKNFFGSLSGGKQNIDPNNILGGIGNQYEGGPN